MKMLFHQINNFTKKCRNNNFKNKRSSFRSIRISVSNFLKENKWGMPILTIISKVLRVHVMADIPGIPLPIRNPLQGIVPIS